MSGLTPDVQLQTPMQALQQVGGAVNAVNQNRLFQGHVAAGQALQQATDPTTGQVDPLKFNRLLAASPDAAIAMQEAALQSQALQGQQQGLQGSRAAIMGSALSSVLAMPDDQLHAGSSAALQRLATQGLIPPFQAAAMTQRLDALKDPAQLRAELAQVQLSMQSPGEQTTQIYGTPSSLSNGQDTISGVTAPARAGGGFAGSTATPVYPSRSELLSQVPGVGPNGAPTATPLGARAGQQGAGALTGPAGAGLAPQGRLPPALLPPGYSGRYAAPQAAAPGGAVPTGLAPGEPETMRAGAEQGLALNSAADQTPVRQGMLSNMLTDLDHFSPGPGQSRETYAQSLVQRYAPDLAKSLGLDPQRVASAESFDKLGTQIAMAQSQALGAGTDQKLLTAMHANPNSGMSKMGVTQIIQMLQGNEDAIQAKNKAWQAFKAQNGAGSYDKFTSDFNQNFEPRVFQAMRMSPEDRSRMLQTMPAPEQKAFRQKFNLAVQSGMIPDPRRAAPNGN